MPKYYLPDYSNCYVNMISSIAKKFKIETGHNTIKELDDILKVPTKNIVVMLLDGMSEDIIKNNLPEDSFLRKNVIKQITSIFPTTTTAGTMSYKTGLTPIEHGWLSLFLYFKEVGESVNLYLNTGAYSRKPTILPNIAENVLGFSNIFERIQEKTKNKVKAYGVSISEARDLFGNITQITYDTFPEMCELLKTLCSLDDKKVIYAYHNHPDSTMHHYGPHSDEVKNLLLDIDAEIEALAKDCPDTTFIISADHGQTYVEKVFDLHDYPDLDNTLLMPPTGGPRAFNLFIKKGREKEFKSLVKKYFKDEFVLFSKKEVLEMNLFGTGTPHPKCDDFLGDFWLISTGKSNLCYTTMYKQSTSQPMGAHGGLTKEEIFLPLIVYKNNKK